MSDRSTREPWTDDAVAANPAGALLHAALTDAQFAVAAAADPLRALMWHAGRLDDGQVAAFAVTQPELALKYAAGRLDDGQVAAAAAVSPEYALQYAADRLDDDLFAVAVAGAPVQALRCAADRLDDAQFDAAAQADPYLAHELGRHRFTLRQRMWYSCWQEFGGGVNDPGPFPARRPRTFRLGRRRRASAAGQAPRTSAGY